MQQSGQTVSGLTSDGEEPKRMKVKEEGGGVWKAVLTPVASCFNRGLHPQVKGGGWGSTRGLKGDFKEEGEGRGEREERERGFKEDLRGGGERGRDTTHFNLEFLLDVFQDIHHPTLFCREKWQTVAACRVCDQHRDLRTSFT